MGDSPAPTRGAGAPAWTCVDSHAHLAMPAFDADREQILARAREAGVTHILSASTTLEDSPVNVRFASSIEAPRVLAAVGVHPHESRNWKDGDEERLAALAADDPVVAIGEAGLDYHYDLSPRDRQRDVLIRQVRLAAKLGLPIIIHCREAASDAAAILEGEGAARVGGVIHCFTEDEVFARRTLALGFHISFSGIITFKNAGALREVARMVPDDRLLAETDAPYLTPVPFRGQRNEPARLPLVLEELARLRECDPAALASSVTANFVELTRSRRRDADPGPLRTG